MSQSRFSIVLVGVSALLRRPLVSRLRPADGERSSWVVFTARVGRFDSGFRSVVGLRVHYFRFSACTDSEWPLGGFVLSPSASEIPFGELAFGFTASVFRHAPLRSGRWAGSFFRLPLRRFRSASWPSGSLLPFFGMHRFGVAAGRVRSFAFRFGDSVRRVGLRVHCFRFSACTASEWPLGGFVLSPSASEIPFGELAFGFTASVFRHAPIRSGRWASSFFRLPHRRLPSAGWFFRLASWPSGSPLPLFGMHRFGDCPRRVGLRAHGFRFSARTASRLPSAAWFFRLASWPSGSPLSLFGTHRFGDCRWASSFFRLPLWKLPSAG